jgi:hypothetical protein
MFLGRRIACPSIGKRRNSHKGVQAEHKGDSHPRICLNFQINEIKFIVNLLMPIHLFTEQSGLQSEQAKEYGKNAGMEKRRRRIGEQQMPRETNLSAIGLT